MDFLCSRKITFGYLKLCQGHLESNFETVQQKCWPLKMTLQGNVSEILW